MKTKGRACFCALSLLILLLTPAIDLAATEPQAEKSGARTDFSVCKDDPFRIDLLETFDALPVDTPEAQIEQLRDWVWSTLLARLAAQRSDPELMAGTAKQPLFRDEGLAHILELPVGRSRSTIGKDGTIYVLVDRSSSEHTYEDILEAIDQESLFLGEVPRQVQVYGATFRMKTAEAEVCHLGSVDQAWLESVRQGFRRAHVSTAMELETFLAGGVDLLSARCTAGKLGVEITGRVRGRTARAPITLEHIAALNHVPGQNLKYVPVADLQVSQDWVSEVREQVQALAAAFDTLPAQGDLPNEIVEDPSARSLVEMIRTWKRQYPKARTEDLMLSYLAQIAAANEIGFSLDPRPDVDKALELLEFLVSDQAGEFYKLPDEARKALETLYGKIQKVGPAQKEKLLLEARFSKVDSVLSESIQDIILMTSYQCARYDGPLQGTEAGMTLFYTDLLAKLWAYNWGGSTPTTEVPGFVGLGEHRLSTAYCGQGEESPQTRIWLGPKQEGYLRNRSDALQFAPVATRLYAMSSGAGSSKEIEPRAEWQRLIHWWNQHYTDVAQWEPQYELLNQLVKWTLVRRMAEVARLPGCLEFMEDVKLEKILSFDQWLEERRDLRWQTPLPFISKPGETTECLELFQSTRTHCGQKSSFSGGVDLPSFSDLVEKPVRVRSSLPQMRRVNPEQRAQKGPGGVLQYASISSPKGQLEQVKVRASPTSVQVSAELHSNIPVRSPDSYRLGKGSVSYRKHSNLRDGGRGVEIQQIQDGHRVGLLTASDISSGSLRVEVRTEEFQKAKQLAFSISEWTGYQNTDFQTAAKKVAAELPTLILDDGQVAIRVSPPEVADGVYAVMGSGGGVRGPPPPLGPRFAIGAADPWHTGPRDSGSLPRGIYVELLRESEAKSYFKRNRARSANESDPIVEVVRKHLGQGDFTAARQALDAPGTPSRALVEYAVGAVEKGRIEGLDTIIDRLLLQPHAAPELRRVERVLARAQIELRRQSGVPQDQLRQLKTFQTKLAIYGRRLQVDEAYRRTARQGEEIPAFIYVRKDVPQEIVQAVIQEGRLPSIGHPPGMTLPPDQGYVTLVIDQATRLSEAPREIAIGGRELKLVELSSQGTRDRPPFPDSPYRLASAYRLGDDDEEDLENPDPVTWPLRIVVPCIDLIPQDGSETAVDDDLLLPDCRVPEGEVANQLRAERMAEELLTMLVLSACDQNEDGSVDGPDEEECLEQLRQRFEEAERLPAGETGR